MTNLEEHVMRIRFNWKTLSWIVWCPACNTDMEYEFAWWDVKNAIMAYNTY